MKKNLKDLSEIVAQANDLFYARNPNIDTLMGIMDKTLRKQGMNADAITIDCLGVKKKIVLVLHDDKPNTVDIALGDKMGEISTSNEYVLENLSKESILKIMEEYFITSH